jgi:hypothetical protein
MPPAAKNLFEKRFLDFQKLLSNKKFCGGARGAVFQKSPPGRRKQELDFVLLFCKNLKRKGVIYDQ